MIIPSKKEQLVYIKLADLHFYFRRENLKIQ